MSIEVPVNNTPLPWGIRKQNDVSILEFDVPDGSIGAGWEQYVFVSSDWHWDNDHCDLVLLKKHLDQAKERNAPVFAFGDLFCLMQGRYDPRRSRGGMRADLDTNDYLDRVVSTASEWFKPYAENMAYFSRGNHELSNIRNNDTDILERFAERLRLQDSPVITGGIGGWIFIRAKINGKSQTLKVAYHHGAGGGGIVTKGVIKASRRATYLPQADIFFSGHIHEEWNLTMMQEHVSAQGKRSLRKQRHVCLPTYKQEYQPSEDDYHCLNERPPKPTGGCWLRLYTATNPEKGGIDLKYELTPAE